MSVEGVRSPRDRRLGPRPAREFGRRLLADVDPVGDAPREARPGWRPPREPLAWADAIRTVTLPGAPTVSGRGSTSRLAKGKRSRKVWMESIIHKAETVTTATTVTPT